LFLPAINFVATAAVARYAFWYFGAGSVGRVFSILGLVSFRGLRRYVARTLPLAATQLVTPYFLAYALPWFTMVASDQALVGAFSVSYRIVLGFSALLAPLVFYMMARIGSSSRIIPQRHMVGFAAVIGAGCWMMGMGLLWFYFHFSKVEPGLYPDAVKYLSILMLGVFFSCWRAPIVSYCTIRARYRPYFLIHLCACLPTLALSLLARSHVSQEAVVWLVCLPDLLATLGLIWYYYSDFRASGARAASVPS
jgi:hypothetical protein